MITIQIAGRSDVGLWAIKNLNTIEPWFRNVIRSLTTIDQIPSDVELYKEEKNTKSF